MSPDNGRPIGHVVDGPGVTIAVIPEEQAKPGDSRFRCAACSDEGLREREIYVRVTVAA